MITDYPRLRALYRDYNAAQPRRLLYGLGQHGFCAEFLGILRAVTWCLANDHQFCFGPQRRNGIAVERGWDDYFSPLFPEVPCRLHPLLNRPVFPLQRKAPVLKPLARALLRALSGCDRFTFDPCFPVSERIVVPALGLDHGYDEARRVIAHMLWSPNARTEEAIAAFVGGLELPARYAAIHVRRGDRLLESPYTPVSAYTRPLARACAGVDSLYVATDDHRVVRELHPIVGDGVRIFSSATSSSTGWHEQDFNRLPAPARYLETVRFMAEFLILTRAEHAIAASPSNVYYLLRVMRAPGSLLDASEDMPA